MFLFSVLKGHIWLHRSVEKFHVFLVRHESVIVMRMSLSCLSGMNRIGIIHIRFDSVHRVENAEQVPMQNICELATELQI